MIKKRTDTMLHTFLVFFMLFTMIHKTDDNLYDILVVWCITRHVSIAHACESRRG